MGNNGKGDRWENKWRELKTTKRQPLIYII